MGEVRVLNGDRFQLLWWGLLYWRQRGGGFLIFWRPNHGLGTIYRWCLLVGPLELRRWQPRPSAQDREGTDG